MIGLLSLDIPSQLEEQRTWLSRHLVGCQLAELVAELAAVFPRAEEGHWPTLEELLGGELEAVLDQGVEALSVAGVQKLLQNPLLMLDLQQHILIDGGAVWQREAMQAADLTGIADRCEASILKKIDAVERLNQEAYAEKVEADRASEIAAGRPVSAAPVPVKRASGTDTAVYNEPLTDVVARAVPKTAAGPRKRVRGEEPGESLAGSRRGSAWRVAGPVAVAAAIVVGFFAGQQWESRQPTVAAAWGWNRPDVMGGKLSRGEYLEKLATSADQWFDQKGASSVDVAVRLSEFRQGCARLQLANHAALDEADRRWLLERCRKWSSQIDQHLARLENGAAVESVLVDANETVHRLVKALRERGSSTTTS
jgi:hypothetical protein